MSKRSMFRKGDVINTNQMREIHRRNKHLPRGPFKVTQVIKTNHARGGYRIIANAAKKGVCVSWVMFYRLSRGPRGGKVESPYHGPLVVIDPEQRASNISKGRKVAKRRATKAQTPPSSFMNKVIPAGDKRTKVLLTLSQFDGDDL